MDLTKRRTEVIAIDPLGEEHMLELWHSGELKIEHYGDRTAIYDWRDSSYVTLATFPADFAVALSENPRIAEALFRELAVDQVSGIIEKAILDRADKRPTPPRVDEDPGDQAVREMFIDVDAKPKAPQPDPNPGAQLGDWCVYRAGNGLIDILKTHLLLSVGPATPFQVGLHYNAAVALCASLNGKEQAIYAAQARTDIRQGRLD